MYFNKCNHFICAHTDAIQLVWPCTFKVNPILSSQLHKLPGSVRKERLTAIWERGMNCIHSFIITHPWHICNYSNLAKTRFKLGHGRIVKSGDLMDMITYACPNSMHIYKATFRVGSPHKIISNTIFLLQYCIRGLKYTIKLELKICRIWNIYTIIIWNISIHHPTHINPGEAIAPLNLKSWIRPWFLFVKQALQDIYYSLCAFTIQKCCGDIFVFAKLAIINYSLMFNAVVFQQIGKTSPLNNAVGKRWVFMKFVL